MKKYVLLIMLSFTFILTIFAVGHTKTDGIQRVKGIRITPAAAVGRVDYTGTVEYADSSIVTSQGSGIVESVFAKNGDKVTKGDVILAVCETYADISSTDIMSSLTSGGLSSVTSLFGADGAVTFYKAEKTGVLSGLELENGAFYLKGQTLFRVSEEKSYRVVLNVSEKDISKIKKDQPVTIDCKALPNVFYGKVSSVGDSASQTSTSSGKLTTVRVTVSIENSPNDLKTGYTADCSIITERREGVLLVPYSAVCTDDSGKSFVYASKGSSVVKREVVQGGEFSNGIEITKGLSSGDIVVYDGSKVADPKKTVIDKVEAHTDQ